MNAIPKLRDGGIVRFGKRPATWHQRNFLSASILKADENAIAEGSS